MFLPTEPDDSFVLLNSQKSMSHNVALASQVAWSASIKVFLREFDSITIGEGAKVEGQLYARRFETSCMVTWPITIDQGAVIHGGAVVYGGAKVGKRW